MLADVRRGLWRPPEPEVTVDALAAVVPLCGADGDVDVRFMPAKLRRLVRADRGRGRLVACSLRSQGPQPRLPVYVHAKITVVDDVAAGSSRVQVVRTIPDRSGCRSAR